MKKDHFGRRASHYTFYNIFEQFELKTKNKET